MSQRGEPQRSKLSAAELLLVSLSLQRIPSFISKFEKRCQHIVCVGILYVLFCTQEGTGRTGRYAGNPYFDFGVEPFLIFFGL